MFQHITTCYIIILKHDRTCYQYIKTCLNMLNIHSLVCYHLFLFSSLGERGGGPGYLPDWLTLCWSPCCSALLSLLTAYLSSLFTLILFFYLIYGSSSYILAYEKIIYICGVYKRQVFQKNNVCLDFVCGSVLETHSFHY